MYFVLSYLNILYTIYKIEKICDFKNLFSLFLIKTMILKNYHLKTLEKNDRIFLILKEIFNENKYLYK